MNTNSTTARTTACTTVRITAFFAATVVTTVLVGSQFGLAHRYEAHTGAVLASQSATGLIALATKQAQAPRG
jgi:hypothetical protein